MERAGPATFLFDTDSRLSYKRVSWSVRQSLSAKAGKSVGRAKPAQLDQPNHETAPYRYNRVLQG